MIAIAKVSPRHAAIDVAARVIAFGVCAAFWWVWLSICLSFIVSVAGSRSIDASSAQILAGAAILATISFAIGLLLMLLLFDTARTWAGTAIAYLGTHRRRMFAVAAAIVRGTLIACAALGGLAAAVYAYALAIPFGGSLILSTAELVEALNSQPSLAMALRLATAFVQMFVAITIFALAIGLPYLGWQRLKRDGGAARRGSL